MSEGRRIAKPTLLAGALVAGVALVLAGASTAWASTEGVLFSTAGMRLRPSTATCSLASYPGGCGGAISVGGTGFINSDGTVAPTVDLYWLDEPYFGAGTGAGGKAGEQTTATTCWSKGVLLRSAIPVRSDGKFGPVTVTGPRPSSTSVDGTPRLAAYYGANAICAVWHHLTHFSGVGSQYTIYPAGSDEADRLSQERLLEAHKPILLYDRDEDFHALSPGAATDFYEAGGGLEDSNQLKDGNGAFATASPLEAAAPELGQLSLETLDATYPPDSARRVGTQSVGSDFVSLRGNGENWLPFVGFTSSGYDSDAAAMEARPGYANRVYGRLASGGDGRVWLQYWIYYYFDSQGGVSYGVHEGDWEMVQIRLDAGGDPDQAAYAQHATGERCNWSQVNTTLTGQPLVYVAQGSHASYFRPDHYDDPSPDDDAQGDGLTMLPEVDQIWSERPTWVAWQGRWGDSDASSPPGPRFQTNGKWSDPSAWADTSTVACGGVSQLEQRH